MEMTPQMIEILKRAKQIDKAAKKFDNGAPKKSQTNGLIDQIGGYDSSPMTESIVDIKKDIGTQDYTARVTNSKLPPAIQKAMLENPIPQPNFVGGVDQEVIKQLREVDEGPTYSEEDEIDMYERPITRSQTQSKRVVNEHSQQTAINYDEKQLRKLIASEISKALPKIIEEYFDSRLVKENVQFKAGSTIFSGNVMPMPKIKGKNNI